MCLPPLRRIAHCTLFIAHCSFVGDGEWTMSNVQSGRVVWQMTVNRYWRVAPTPGFGPERRRRSHFEGPNGALAQSPRLPRSGYLGYKHKSIGNPNGVAARGEMGRTIRGGLNLRRGTRPQPLRG